jgi:pheromone a factor receptor
VAGALLFFGYFRFVDEAIKNYRGAFQSGAKRMGYTMAGSSGVLSSTGYLFLSFFFSYISFHYSLSSPNSTSKFPLSSSGRPTLPVFIRKETTQKRDSFDSFSHVRVVWGRLAVG